MSPDSDDSRTGTWVRASTTTSTNALVITETERMASSFPGMGTVIRSGSALVSTIATTGMPSLLASAIAIRSFFASTMKMTPGKRVMFLMPSRFRLSFCCSRSNPNCSFFVKNSYAPSESPCSISFRRRICFLMVWKLVNVPPSQRSVT